MAAQVSTLNIGDGTIENTEFYTNRKKLLENYNDYISFDDKLQKILSINIATILKNANDANAQKNNLKNAIKVIKDSLTKEVKDTKQMYKILLDNAAKLSAIKVLTLIYAVFAFLSINPPKKAPEFPTKDTASSLFTSNTNTGTTDYNPFISGDITIFEAVNPEQLPDIFTKCNEITTKGFFSNTVADAAAIAIKNFNSANQAKFNNLVTNIKTKLVTSLVIDLPANADAFNDHCKNIALEHLKLQYEQALAKFNYKYALDSTALYANLSINESS